MVIANQTQIANPGGVLLPKCDIVCALGENDEVEADGGAKRDDQPKPDARTQKPAGPFGADNCLVGIAGLHWGCNVSSEACRRKKNRAEIGRTRMKKPLIL